MGVIYTIALLYQWQREKRLKIRETLSMLTNSLGAEGLSDANAGDFGQVCVSRVSISGSFSIGNALAAVSKRSLGTLSKSLSSQIPVWDTMGYES